MATNAEIVLGALSTKQGKTILEIAQETGLDKYAVDHQLQELAYTRKIVRYVNRYYLENK